MARKIYKEYHRMPSWNLVVVIFLFQQWGVFPMAHSSWLWSRISKIQGLPTTLGTRICEEMSLVPKQRQMCLEDPKIMLSVGEGAFNGICECKHQFRNDRWNCSTMEKGLPVLGKVIDPGSKEAAFVHAITAAGVMYSVTRSCSRGDILSCSCDPGKRGTGRDIEGNYSFTWGGCSDDIENGSNFVENFVDASEQDGHDARAQMNLHNNRAGRRAVKKYKRRQCKCHGTTGSCQLRTCWDAMGDFRETGDYLKKRYDDAVKVMITQNGIKGQLVSNDRRSEPNKNDLVFLESSPDYCDRDPKLGIFGTAGRECNAESKGSDGCEKLCCGRGYNTTSVTRIEECMCKFHWCCEVRCEKCSQTIDIHTCKGPEEAESSHTPATQKPKKGRGRKGKGGKKKGRNRKGGKRKGGSRGGARSAKRRTKRDIREIPSDQDLRYSDTVEWESFNNIERHRSRRRFLRKKQGSFPAATVIR